MKGGWWEDGDNCIQTLIIKNKRKKKGSWEIAGEGYDFNLMTVDIFLGFTPFSVQLLFKKWKLIAFSLARPKGL